MCGGVDTILILVRPTRSIYILFTKIMKIIVAACHTNATPMSTPMLCCVKCSKWCGYTFLFTLISTTYVYVVFYLVFMKNVTIYVYIYGIRHLDVQFEYFIGTNSSNISFFDANSVLGLSQEYFVIYSTCKTSPRIQAVYGL